MTRSPGARPRPLDRRVLRASPALRRHVVVLGAAITLRTLCTVLAAGFLAAAVSHVLHGTAGAVLHRDLVALVAVVLTRAALDGLLELAGERAGGQVRRELRSAAMRALAEAGPAGLGSVDQARTAHLLGAGSDVLVPYVSRVLPALVGAAITPAGVLVAVLWTDLPSFVLLVVVLPLLPLFLALLGITTRERTSRSYATLARLSAKVLDLLQGLPTLKVYGRAEGQLRAMERVTEQHRHETFAALRWAFVSGLALDVLATLSVALVAVDAGLRLQSGGLALAPALTALLLAPEVFAPLRAVGMQFHASTEALECTQDLLRLIEMPAQRAPEESTTGTALVDLEAVSVRHPGREVGALRAVSLTLHPGEVLAVEGPSGAGKSTLLDVLSGAVTPDVGLVLRSPSATPWRSRLAVCPQRPRTTGRTAGDELALAEPQASSEQIEQALADCAAPTGRTPLGEGGRAVSAGQLRRVGLARALLRARAVLALGETPLLLWDEPTEDLDPATATVVHQLVDQLRGRATVVLVTHSPELAAIADRRLLLRAGQVETEVRSVPSHAGGASLPRQLDRESAPDRPAPAVRLRPLLTSLRADARGLGGRLAL
ncbi:MAG: transporter, CydDC cysteine exporter (CydDC-E) family, permease/ATP-binding protein CydC, partial [Frankiales bacterium]|nr:transporter, CydDC cysteine exporter (CydDC-E) family, permease/ATP-binding protein CydC [Frankiales bacterium]